MVGYKPHVKGRKTFGTLSVVGHQLFPSLEIMPSIPLGRAWEGSSILPCAIKMEIKEIETYLKRNGFETKVKSNAVFAERKDTWKKIVVINKDRKSLTNNEVTALVNIWTRFNIHPFLVTNNKFYDFIFNEFVNEV